MSEEQANGLDSDPVESRLFKGLETTFCIKCGRSLKGKVCYLTAKDNEFRCYDEGTKETPTEAIICRCIQATKEALESFHIRFTSKMAKQIERIIRDSL